MKTIIQLEETAKTNREVTERMADLNRKFLRQLYIRLAASALV